MSGYFVYFRSNTLGKPLIPQVMANILWSMFFYKDDFRIKKATNVDILLNKENI